MRTNGKGAQRQDQRHNERGKNRCRHRGSFSTAQRPGTGRSRKDFPDIQCFKCNNYGHYATSCVTPTNKRKERPTNAPKQQEESEGQQMLQVKAASDVGDDKDEVEHGVMFLQFINPYTDLPDLLSDWEESDSDSDSDRRSG